MEGVMLQLQKASMCCVVYWREYTTAHAQPKEKAFNLIQFKFKKKKKEKKKIFSYYVPLSAVGIIWTFAY